MGYIPKFAYLDHFINVCYPFGIHWKHNYIKKSTRIIYDTYKSEIEEGTTIAFIARGTSGAMIAGAMLNELHSIDSYVDSRILIVRKENDTSAHCSSLKGIEELKEARLIVVDDFISSGDTVEAILRALDTWFETPPSPMFKYDMLVVSNYICKEDLKKNTGGMNYRMWKGICSRFDIVVCCPKPD